MQNGGTEGAPRGDGPSLKSVFYPPKCGNMVKMLDARNFFHFFLERRVRRFHGGIVHPPAAIIDRATRADRGVETPPLIG